MIMELVQIFKIMNILITIAKELNKMEDSERIEEALKKMSRNDKLSVVYGKQDLHSLMNQSRLEGLPDQESTGIHCTRDRRSSFCICVAKYFKSRGNISLPLHNSVNWKQTGLRFLEIVLWVPQFFITWCLF